MRSASRRRETVRLFSVAFGPAPSHSALGIVKCAGHDNDFAPCLLRSTHPSWFFQAFFIFQLCVELLDSRTQLLCWASLVWLASRLSGVNGQESAQTMQLLALLRQPMLCLSWAEAWLRLPALAF